MKHERRRWRVYGTVQGVGFRYFTVHAARRLGLAGHARNLDDGTVEVEAAGAPAALDELLHTLKNGPPGSRVLRIDVQEPGEADLPTPFTVRR